MEKTVDSSSEDETSRPSAGKSKKRKMLGRVRDVMKKLRATTFETGPDCKCTIHKCFKKFLHDNRSAIIKSFNELGEWNKQSAHLASLITLVPIKRRYVKGNEEDANFRECSFKYTVRILENGTYIEKEVCRQGFISLHGITKSRVSTIQTSLKRTGLAPVDQRGKHNNRMHKLKDEDRKLILDHINSFKGRVSHYSLKRSSKIYLPEDLNVKKMYDMFRELHPLIQVSYEKYRQIFQNDFNISFGYPRCETCSTCDKHTAQIIAQNSKLLECSLNAEEKAEVSSKIKSLNTLQEFHLRHAHTFYARKRIARKKSRKDVSKESVCIDYQRNLPVPNITTNDVYYRRQLSYYTCNIHVLSTGKSTWYGYSEDVAKKGSNEVVSFVHLYITNFLDPKVKHLSVFCDSCSGQNKNYNVLRYLHYVVHVMKRLESVCITFPCRGHSFMECDKNMGLVDTKRRVEVPSEWAHVITDARKKPEPFIVVEVDQSIVRDWSSFFDDNGLCNYIKKCPFATRPLKEAKVKKEHPRFIQHRSSYNAAWNSSVITTRVNKIHLTSTLAVNKFFFPDRAYNELLPISEEKFNDLRQLKQFCSADAGVFFDTLKCEKKKPQKQ